MPTSAPATAPTPAPIAAPVSAVANAPAAINGPMPGDGQRTNANEPAPDSAENASRDGAGRGAGAGVGPCFLSHGFGGLLVWREDADCVWIEAGASFNASIASRASSRSWKTPTTVERWVVCVMKSLFPYVV